MTALFTLLLSSVANPLPAEFDLSDLAPPASQVGDRGEGARYLLGEIEDGSERRDGPSVRLRGARVKVRVPIG